MPGLGGVECAGVLLQLRPDLPVIFATGYDKEKALGNMEHELSGNTAILGKPLNMPELSQKLDQMLKLTS